MKSLVFVLTFLFLSFVNSQNRPDRLNRGQQFPNEDEYKVCGRIRDVIPRNSGRFRKILIRNSNSEAQYSNEDSRRMTARAKSKLDILASRVRAYWSGRAVTVIKAWTDQVNSQDRLSLHYEGRSLRLQVSDGDRGKLGKLAGLALEAGFDWVKYEADDYIRASVIPDVCQTSVDLVFLLDGSGSVQYNNFQKVKKFVKKVIDFFNIGRTGTHIAVVQYSTNTKTEFDLGRYFTKTDMKSAVDRIPYQNGWTYTAEALKFLRNNIFITQAGMRDDPGIPKVLVLLTDGKSQGDPVSPPAQVLKNMGVSIFSIGVGSGVSISQLNAIASDPDSEYVFQRTFDNLIAGWVDRLSAVSCSEGSLINSCDESSTSVESGSFKYFRTKFQFVTGNQVSVELRDKKGVSHLYASRTSKNPGPLDPQSEKNEANTSPKAVSVRVDHTKTVFVAAQGQKDDNEFILSFWDNLFSSPTFNYGFLENRPSQLVATLTLATSSYRLKYSITDGNIGNAFRIDERSPSIYTTKRLDRETTAKYSLVIVAVNEANKCHKSRTNVIINVKDENDNAPKFTKDSYEATVYENTQLGAIITRVLATDPDDGNNGKVTYRITSQTPENRFRIDQQGQIILTGDLDYEREQTYTVKLQARDGGGKTDTSNLIVRVLNVNEAPKLTCKGGNCHFSVDENVGSGTTFNAQLIGTDPDTGCTLTYGLHSSVNNVFNVNQNSGVISTKGKLDREKHPNYDFTATVKDCGGLTASVRVTVTVRDLNDNNPRFSGSYSVDILESEGAGSNVVQVQAADADEGNNAKITYSLTGADSTSFTIDSTNGKIATKTILDYERKTSYTFTVVATDGGQPQPKKGTSQVTVNVVDVNDNKPIFGGPYTKSVPENATRGTNVITVKATDKDSGDNGKVRYSIVGGNYGNAFRVDGSSGKITVNAKLDRETRSSYTLIVQASDLGSPSLNDIATVAITITDVNDNYPVFQGLPYQKYVPEDYSTTKVVLKVTATDEDAGNNGEVFYSIKSPQLAKETFTINTKTGEIRLKKALDYESSNKDYTFDVAATDGGGKESTGKVKIFVTDVNDNEPEFQNQPYRENVAENVNVGHVVGTVLATDKDSGPRGRVSYSITAGGENAFRINAAGTVTVASALDREKRDSYTLTIKAKDDGQPAKSSTSQFTIKITDINDNAPSFGKSSYSFNIAEENKLNAEVGVIGKATDQDIGVNAEIVYSIVSGNLNTAFEFQASGKLIAKKKLDRETTASYLLVIEARDKGNSPLFTRVPVKVIVDDINDNDPRFDKQAYNCRIDENSAQNSRVCFVQATDADIGINGQIVYEFVSKNNEFSISQDDGEITTKISPDRENTPSYTFVVRARDRGTPSRNSAVSVTVTVVDENDNEPKFDKDYSFEVKEDATKDTKVDEVNASDPDEGSNGEVVYSITGGNTRSAFSIAKSTGVISVNSKLDRETLANYKLTVRASDKGNPALSTSKDVPIKILDVNDNDPIFTSKQYSGRIAEDAAIGSRVVQVKATDLDEGVNGQIKYSITGGDQKEHFSVDPDSGLITTAQKLDYETKKSYQLTVKATDQGLQPRSSTSTVDIQVKNTNDNAPTFVPGSPVVEVSEAVAIGTNVVQFNATDEDGNKLTFSITKGNTNSDLKVDKDTGLLTTNKKLDRETTPFYNLTVTVSESITRNRQSISRNLSVVVTDENDNAPVFDPKQYTKDINENTVAGAVLTVSASDKDVGKNAEISYSLDSASTAKFTIDSKTGEISTKNALDYEERSSYDIIVTARDAGTPSLSSTANVKINVNDLNDNKPRFTQDYTTTLRENTGKGGTVLRVEASDPDSGENGKIEYNITSGNELGFFALDAEKGIIRVEKPPDRESNPSFILNIHASNKPAFLQSTPPAKTDCSVRIDIEDANDNAPNITNTVSTFKIVENSPVSSEVLDVDATDADVGNNGKIEYEIDEGNVNDAFQIDKNNGVISTKGTIDRETLDVYTLKVKASDKGNPKLSSTKDFVIQVTDVDDNAPVFNPSSYDESVPESTSLNTSVVRLLATDEDIGKNAEIIYSIASGNEKDHFRIDGDSGFIYTKALLDFEKLKQYNLVVEGKDTKHTTQANVIIRVENVNDNDPVFQPSSYELSVPENQALDNTVVTVTATDKDPFGELIYSFDPPSSMFTVNPSSGEISLVSKLDRETTDYYNLTVRVTDGGSPARSDTAVVKINVTDVNDNPPIFNSSQGDVSVLENSEAGKVLYTVAATDADIGVNAELRYKILEGNEANKFKLDPDSGVLTVFENIDREKIESFRLTIVAVDQGTPSRQSEPLVITVTVLDENDNDPIFTEKRYEQNITENLSGGTFVKEVEAIDYDIGENARVSYAILSGAKGYFRINNDTGIVETTKPLDREDVPSFLLTIEARDHGSPSRNSTVVLQVNVKDANDNSPRLGTVIANVTEEQPKGIFVTRILATDPDLGESGEVEYNLTIRGNQWLNIDRKTGNVTTKVKFDYEAQRQHTFKVIATDKGNPSLFTTADLIINVIDIDDNCPEFNPKEYNITVEENIPFGTEILNVTARDVDTVGGKLEYGIRSGNSYQTFSIKRYVGTLLAGRSVDRENAAEYNLVVRAGNDYCGVNRTGIDTDESIEVELSKSIAKVNVFLTDVNDNAPVFLKDTYKYDLKNIYVETLLWLNASDPDEGLNGEFDFGLDGVTRVGQDRILVITATDRGDPQMSSNTTLNVTGVRCEAMRFSVSPRGKVSVKSLCIFDKVVVPKSAFVDQSAVFNCSARGNTVPEYRWLRNGLPITDWLKNGEYRIKTLTKSDDGVYSCIASSEAGNVLSKGYRFIVKEPARIVAHPEDIWVETDKRAVLSCRATGDPKIEYKWYKNNVLLPSSEGVTAGEPDLVLSKVIPQDAGDYHCEVSNYRDAPLDKSRKARIEVYAPDAVVEMKLTVDKPFHKESCQYFNMTAIKETIGNMIDGEVAVVDFEKTSELCNLTGCSSNPCYHNGRCEAKGSSFVCHCPREWTGTQCQIDVNECESGTTCGNNGTCLNKRGSFSCECTNSTITGKLCQFTKKNCESSNCAQGNKCYPKDVVDGYQCLPSPRTVSMVYKLNELKRPFEEWMLYDVAKEIENAISNAVVLTRDGGRTRRDTTTVDYSSCSVRVVKHTVQDTTELNLDIMLICDQAPNQEYVCKTMFDQGMVSSCTDEKGTHEAKPTIAPPDIAPARVSLAFVVRKPDGNDRKASETIGVLREGNLEGNLEKQKLYDIELQARSSKIAETGSSGTDLSSGAITGVVVGVIVLIVLVVLVAFLAMRRRQGRGKEFSIGRRAILSRTQSTDAIVSHDINMRELKNAEARGMNNKTFSEIYEENDGNPKYGDGGTFMVENEQLALRKHDQEYMKELESSPWFHGSITRAKAEELLDTSDNEGAFLVRSGLDMGEFYISVRTPNAEPKFRHICVYRRDENFVAVCDSEAKNFTNFNELVDYLRENPTKIEGVNGDVVLKEHIAKV